MAIPSPEMLEEYEAEILKNIIEGAKHHQAGKLGVAFGRADGSTFHTRDANATYEEYLGMKKYTNGCHYCGEPLDEVGGDRIWPHREDLAKKRFAICWPCSAWVGLKDDGTAQGRK